MSAAGLKTENADSRAARRKTQRGATRTSIIEAARRVADRDGARDFSLRGVAAEAGFAPAALYGYFQNKDELLLALAADDLGQLSRAMREKGGEGFAAAAGAALKYLGETQTMTSLPPSGAAAGEAERLFNGRMIGALKTLSEAGGLATDSRESQCDVLLAAATLTGLAMMERAGRLKTLGFTSDELVAQLSRRFS